VCFLEPVGTFVFEAKSVIPTEGEAEAEGSASSPWNKHAHRKQIPPFRCAQKGEV
jgi:hypothetical protein